MKKLLKFIPIFIIVITLTFCFTAPIFGDPAGFNFDARIYAGIGDGIDGFIDGTVFGDPTYANDLLILKWSKAMDDARFHGGAWSPDAWEIYRWNGMVPGGSGNVWQFKIFWVGPELMDSPYWREGGLPIFDYFEIIMYQGTFDGNHFIFTHVVPNGFGAN